MPAPGSAVPTTIFCHHVLLTDGWATRVRMTVRFGHIVALEVGAIPQPGDLQVGCMLPGIANAHSHAFQRGMAGLAERRGPTNDSFWTWRDVMYRFLDRLSPEDMHAIAALAYVEMLESGFTRVGEFHYLHHDRDGNVYGDPATMGAAITQAAADSGIGLTLLPVFYARAGFGAPTSLPLQRRFVTDLDTFARIFESSRRVTSVLPDAVVGVAPHSLRAVTSAQLQVVGTLAPDAPIHIHVAEQVREVEECVAWTGQRPVEWLLDNCEVDSRWCLVHATHMTPSETRALARSGATAGVCPATEANLGDGLFPLEQFLLHEGSLAIGSDSNIRIDLPEELRLLEYGQRLMYRRRNVGATASDVSTGARLHAAALDGGSLAVGSAAGLSIGRPADMYSLDINHPSLMGKTGDTLTDGLIFSAGCSAIDGVWRLGDKLVAGGKHRIRDDVVRRYRAAVDRLWS